MSLRDTIAEAFSGWTSGDAIEQVLDALAHSEDWAGLDGHLVLEAVRHYADTGPLAHADLVAEALTEHASLPTFEAPLHLVAPSAADHLDDGILDDGFGLDAGTSLDDDQLDDPSLDDTRHERVPDDIDEVVTGSKEVSGTDEFGTEVFGTEVFGTEALGTEALATGDPDDHAAEGFGSFADLDQAGVDDLFEDPGDIDAFDL
jgi:hypothetical protein